MDYDGRKNWIPNENERLNEELRRLIKKSKPFHVNGQLWRPTNSERKKQEDRKIVLRMLKVMTEFDGLLVDQKSLMNERRFISVVFVSSVDRISFACTFILWPVRFKPLLKKKQKNK